MSLIFRCDWCGEQAATVSYRTLYEGTEFEHTGKYRECPACAALSTKDLLDKVEAMNHNPENKQ